MPTRSPGAEMARQFVAATDGDWSDVYSTTQEKSSADEQCK